MAFRGLALQRGRHLKHSTNVAAVSEISLAPGLLLSMPHLADPNFHRAVVLMVEHDDEGSFGLVLNQPSEMYVSQLFDMLDMRWNGPDDDVVWTGGPVMPTSGWVLHGSSDAVGPGAADLSAGLEGDGTIAIVPGLDLSTSPEKLERLADEPPPQIRFLLGYSGWGPGQLAEEMARGSWLHADVALDIVFGVPPDEMWARALRSIGVDPETIVRSRGVH